ncbi:MAG TPA: SDR family oxidoreductase [Melioribacteraceae bacterium]|nr:SDR family oxidoreductase [Melioribacteraceae bacterium]
MKILVTGGAGFIGSNIVDELLKRNHSVRILDNFSTGKRENIQEFFKDIELIEGDIRNYTTVENSVKGIEVILHQAALPSVPRSINDPLSTNEVNISGTLNILEAARLNGVRRLIFASSSSVYGNSTELPKHEGLKPNPLSPYAVSKLTGEYFCKVYSEIYGLETIALRYFNVFGPRQDPNSEYSAVIPKFIKAFMENRQPVIYGDGTQSRDFTYVENVVEANILAISMMYQSWLTMNCATSNPITLNELVKQLNSLSTKNIIPIYNKSKPGDIKHSYADISLIRNELGYKPKTDFINGLFKLFQIMC